MIAVQVELWPLGSERPRKTIASMVIENRGLDSSGISYRYAAELHHTADPVLQISAVEQSIEICGHHRQDAIWTLIHRVLSAALAENSTLDPVAQRDGDRDPGVD